MKNLSANYGSLTKMRVQGFCIICDKYQSPNKTCFPCTKNFIGFGIPFPNPISFQKSIDFWETSLQESKKDEVTLFRLRTGHFSPYRRLHS